MGPSPVESLMLQGGAPGKVRPESGVRTGETAKAERFSGALKRAERANAEPQRGPASELRARAPEGGPSPVAVEPGPPAEAQEGASGAQEPAREAQEPVASATEGSEYETAEEGSTALEPSPSSKTEGSPEETSHEIRRTGDTESNASAVLAVKTEAKALGEAELAHALIDAESEQARTSAAPTVEVRPEVAQAPREAQSGLPAREARRTASIAARVEPWTGEGNSPEIVHDIPEPEAQGALSGSHVEDSGVGEEEAQEIRRIAAQAESHAGRAERAGEGAGRERTSPSSVLERAEGRLALDRLIDAARVTEPRAERASESARGSVVEAGAPEARDGAVAQSASTDSGNSRQESRGESKGRDARTSGSIGVSAPKAEPGHEPAASAKPAPENPATIGLTNFGATKPAREAIKPGAAEMLAGRGADVEAAASRGLMAAVQQKGGAVTVRLEPETLGSMRIRMELTGGVVRATFEVTTLEARDLLGSRLDSLRSALEAKGLGVERLQVQLTSAGQGGAANNDSSSGEGRWQGSRSSPDAGEGKTRGDTGGGRDRHDGEPQDRRGSPGFAGALGGAWREEWVRIGVDALV